MTNWVGTWPHRTDADLRVRVSAQVSDRLTTGAEMTKSALCSLRHSREQDRRPSGRVARWETAHRGSRFAEVGLWPARARPEGEVVPPRQLPVARQPVANR